MDNEGDWLDITTIEDASRGKRVMLNSVTGEPVRRQLITEIEPTEDGWRQFEVSNG